MLEKLYYFLMYTSNARTIISWKNSWRLTKFEARDQTPPPRDANMSSPPRN